MHRSENTNFVKCGVIINWLINSLVTFSLINW